MRYIQGIERNQTVMFPETLDSYITEENLVRFIDKYVDSLDLQELGFTYSETKETGRKPYKPSLMLKLYIYGYLNRIRSSRHLETESQRNVELMWLMEKLSPDFKTISDFRKNNKQSIKKVFREFVLLSRKLGLIGGDIVAIDGSKFRAVNSKDNNYTKRRLSIMLQETDEQINKYLNDIDRTDNEEVKIKKLDIEELSIRINDIEKEKAEIKALLKEIEDGNNTQISRTDSDSRMMETRDGQQMSYNVQVSVDSANRMIIDYEITNEINDRNCLSTMAISAKEILETEGLKVVGDMGYFNRQEIGICDDNNIESYIPIPQQSSNGHKGLFRQEEFTYLSESDRYICPAGQALIYKYDISKNGLILRRYVCSACKSCPIKSKCTTSKSNRYINRWVREEAIDAMKERLRKNKGIIKARKGIIEHVFGTIKHSMGLKHFLMKGKEKVSCEMGFTALAYNIRRAINILGVKKLILAT